MPDLDGVDRGSIHVHARQLVYEFAYREVHQILDRSGIPLLVLKGPHLASIVYESPTLRDYCDLDLLVKPSHFMRTAEILKKEGYKVFPLPQQLASWKSQSAWVFRSPRGVYVDLHRGFSEHGWPVVDTKALFDRAEYFFFGETRASGLERHDLLIHLCIHAGKRAFSTLAHKHLQDIAQLLARGEIDWDLFRQRAHTARAMNLSYYALEAVKQQFGAVLPATLLQHFRPGPIRRLLLGRALDPSRFPLFQFSIGKGAMRRLVSCLLIDTVPKRIGYLTRFLAVQLQDRRLRRDSFRRIWLKKNPEIRNFLK